MISITYFADAFQYPDADHVSGPESGGEWRQYGQYRRQENANAEHVFSAVFLRKHTARYLGDYVSVIKSTEDMSLQGFGPIEFRVLRML